MKVTSAHANKILRQLNEEKDYWINVENESMLYTASVNEEPVIPEYDYEKVSAKIESIDKKICKIKHAINHSNISSEVEVGGEKITIDALLVRMAQITKRKNMLGKMRKQLPKSRVEGNCFSNKSIVEYRYANYDIEKVMEDYDKISRLLFEMQMKLDEHNQTVLFELDIE